MRVTVINQKGGFERYISASVCDETCAAHYMKRVKRALMVAGFSSEEAA